MTAVSVLCKPYTLYVRLLVISVKGCQQGLYLYLPNMRVTTFVVKACVYSWHDSVCFQTVPIPDVSYACFRAMLKFLYTDTLDTSITLLQVVELMKGE